MELNIPSALVLGCNTPHGINVLSDWIEEQTGYAPDLYQSGWDDSNERKSNTGDGYGIGEQSGYGNGDTNYAGSGGGNGCGYGCTDGDGCSDGDYAYYSYGYGNELPMSF